MDQNTEAFAKLAEDLTARVDELEKDNARLRDIAQRSIMLAKNAAVSMKEEKPVVSKEIVDATLSTLVKCGGLSPEQVDESREILLKDAAAPHRILQRFLDAQSQTKTAADAGNVSGGTLIGADKPKEQTGRDACLDRMASILKMYE